MSSRNYRQLTHSKLSQSVNTFEKYKYFEKTYLFVLWQSVGRPFPVRTYIHSALFVNTFEKYRKFREYLLVRFMAKCRVVISCMYVHLPCSLCKHKFEFFVFLSGPEFRADGRARGIANCALIRALFFYAFMGALAVSVPRSHSMNSLCTLNGTLIEYRLGKDVIV